jgi:hypothetical protein
MTSRRVAAACAILAALVVRRASPARGARARGTCDVRRLATRAADSISGNSVSGRVISNSGAELVGAEVEVFRKIDGTYDVDPMPVAFGQTEGPSATVRFTDLPRGEYYVRAYTPDPIPPSDVSPITAYAPTFFPDAIHLADAQPIVIRGGENLYLSIKLAVVNTHSVSGRVVVPKDERLLSAHIELASRGPGTETARPRASVARDGEFRMRGVLPGDYILLLQGAAYVNRRLSAHPALKVVGDVMGVAIAAELDADVDPVS